MTGETVIDRIDRGQAGTLFGWALLALLVLALCIVLLPMVQTVAYTTLVATPAVWYWLIVGGIVGGLAYTGGYPSVASTIWLAAIVMAVFVGPFFSGIYAQEHILANQEFEQQAELPETSSEHVRVLPRNVANRYAQSANQLPKYRTGSADIAYQNGSYTWSYGVVPDRPYVAWRGNQWGAYYVDMEQTSRSVETSRTEMEYGMGMVVFDSYGYQFNLNRLDVHHRPGTSFVFEHEGETHIAQSYVRHEWQFRFLPFPQPYTVPKYGGTQVVDSDGDITDLEPDEVVESEMLDGQNTYPYQLARFRMKSMQLRNGLLNKMFVGDGVPQIANTGGFSDNKQPFTVPTGTGGDPELTYFIAATPSGSGDGIYQIYTIDGQSGSIEYVQFDDTQTGPQKAAGFTRSQNRAPNWAANNDGGSTQITEPIPLVIRSCSQSNKDLEDCPSSSIDGDLYWHMRVTPTDGARVSYTTFVSADTGDVYRADNTQSIYEFIESGGATTVEDGGSDQNASDGSDGVFTVTVIGENGDIVDQYTVTDEQSVRISASDRNETRTATATG